MESVNFSQVAIEDKIWKPVILMVWTITIPVGINLTEVMTARIWNFEKVAAKKAKSIKVFIMTIMMYIKPWMLVLTH